MTLGAFSDVFGLPGGTDFMVASTFFHELGHNIELRHGAAQASVGGPIVPAPNCIPTYLSSMNYLYQLRGLLDDSGKPHLDFSSGIGISLNEAAGNDGEYSFKYRIGWYAPLAGSYFAYPDPAVPGGILSRTTVAGRHCDGSLMSSMDPFMVRVDARSAVGAIDWNANGRLDEYSNQDLNFNGATAELPQAFNDWANIRLNQVGAGRNVGGPFIDANGYRAFGPLSADLARADWARADWARADWARADWARADWARADWARADWGDLSQGDTVRYGLARADWARADWARADWARADWARADWGRGDDGRGDFGGGDLFVGNPDNPGGELDFETATELAKTPPNEFTATVAASGALASWKAPNIGGVTGYIVYRVPGSELGQAWQQVSGEIAEVSPGMYTLVDGAQLLNGAPYTYFAVALYADGIQSDPSNLVTITAVNKPPVADGDSYTTDEDTPLIQAAPGVLDGDADPDSNGTLTAVLVTGPSHGTLVLNANGSFTYTPAADFNGEDSFTYKATATYGPADPTVDTNIAPVTITVAPVNDAPLALSDLYTTDEDTPLTQAAPGVLANDADADSSLTAVLVNGPSHGTLTLNADGSFSYTPAANYDGEDSFTYTANDGLVDSSPATVSITVTPVNDAPVAGDDGYSTLEDTALSQAAPGVLVNDTDAESALTAILVTGPSHGTLILNANGSFTYTPVLNYSGPDAFTYKANDGTTYTGDATVSLTVTAVNDSPVAVDDGYTTTEDTALSVAAAGVLGNDTDADSTPTAVLVAGPSHGTLVLNPDGSFTYTPAANYNGPDAFTYRANDGELDSSPATVALTVTPVNDAPAAGNDGYTTTEDTALSVAAAGVLGNDTDVDNLLAAVLVSGPAHGLLVLNANGSFTYTPAANYNGPDVFTYKAYDGTFYTDPVTVSIAVTSVNDAPTISNIADRTINANTGTGTVSFTIGDDDLATVVVTGSASNATLVPTANIVFGGSGANRTVTVTPAANQSGTVTITVTVTDGGGLTAVDTFVLTVKAVGYALLNVKNLPPAAGVTFKPSSTGTLVDLEWKFTTNGTVVNSADARPIVTITGPGGYSKTLSGGGANDCSNFEYKTKDNKWDVHWQPKNAAVGTYYVVVTSQKTGQRFPDSGPGFPVVFKQ